MVALEIGLDMREFLLEHYWQLVVKAEKARQAIQDTIKGWHTLTIAMFKDMRLPKMMGEGTPRIGKLTSNRSLIGRCLEQRRQVCQRCIKIMECEQPHDVRNSIYRSCRPLTLWEKCACHLRKNRVRNLLSLCERRNIGSYTLNERALMAHVGECSCWEDSQFVEVPW